VSAFSLSCQSLLRNVGQAFPIALAYASRTKPLRRNVKIFLDLTEPYEQDIAQSSAMSKILHNSAPSTVLEHVSENLRRLRQAAGLSQTALAHTSGISRRTIVSVEAGDANISLSGLDKLAAAIGVRFADLVRDPTRESRSEINEVTWRGTSSESSAILLCSAPASVEAQMWIWTLGPGERYDAEPDPEGWHESIYVIEGVLRLTLSGERKDHAAGSYAVYGTSQVYSYENPGPARVRFVRNVIS
jgi:transcriptional regulator with XRE-family HTH domain